MLFQNNPELFVIYNWYERFKNILEKKWMLKIVIEKSINCQLMGKILVWSEFYINFLSQYDGFS